MPTAAASGSSAGPKNRPSSGRVDAYASHAVSQASNWSAGIGLATT